MFLILCQLSILIYLSFNGHFFLFTFSKTPSGYNFHVPFLKSLLFVHQRLYFVFKHEILLNDKKSCILHDCVNASFPRFPKEPQRALFARFDRPSWLKNMWAVAVISTEANSCANGAMSAQSWFLSSRLGAVRQSRQSLNYSPPLGIITFVAEDAPDEARKLLNYQICAFWGH